MPAISLSFFFPLQFGNEGHTQEIVCSSGTRIGDENHLGFADTGRPWRVVDGSPVTFFFFLGFLCCTDGGFEKLDQI